MWRSPSSINTLPGKLTSVTDDYGYAVLFSYDNTNKLKSVTDPAGQAYGVGYDGSGFLNSMTYPDGTALTYLYGEAEYSANLGYVLTGIVDQAGGRYATFTYRSFPEGPRAVATEHAGGVNRYMLDYTSDTTTVTDSAECHPHPAPHDCQRRNPYHGH